MTDRKLKIALAVSVALNVFVVGAVAGGLIVGGRFLAEKNRPDRPHPMELVSSLPEPDRETAVATLREAGLEARPQFEAARRQRAEAIELAAAETFDRAAVSGALARSRDAELAGRARLEGAMLDVMQPLERSDRRILAEALARRGPDGRGRGHRRFSREDAPPPVEAPAEAAAPEAPPADLPLPEEN